MTDLDFDFIPRPAKKFSLRGYQSDWISSVRIDRAAGKSRLLIDAPGGTGKTSVFAALAANEWREHNGRTLVLANRDRLVGQTAKRIREETGLDVSVEMADSHACMFAPVVVASVQTLSRANRLASFPDNHFALVVPDEAHRSLAESWQRVLKYFHYGEESLGEHWAKPKDGSYTPKAIIVGTTATPDIGKKKNLGQFFQKITASYSYLHAVNDGWLVQPTTASVPIQIDLRHFKAARTPNGADFKPEDLSKQMIPIIEELAKQVVKMAPLRKTMCFLPSVECARLMADAINRLGLKAIFVSGECLDVDEKTEAFVASGRGTVLCLCSIYVEGIDFPDVDCIAWFRATLSRAWFIQGIYRGTRVLPGVVRDDMTAEERRAAIAASAKPDLLILDPLFVSDRIDLCTIYDLFTDQPEVKARMKEMGGIDMAAASEMAERDFIAALEKEAKKHARKDARVFDPLTWSVSVCDEKLEKYVPIDRWEADPPSAAQLSFLKNLHMDTAKIPSKGLAQRIIGVLLTRMSLKLATPGQLDFMRKLGIDEKVASRVTVAEASKLIDQSKLKHELERAAARQAKTA